MTQAEQIWRYIRRVRRVVSAKELAKRTGMTNDQVSRCVRDMRVRHMCIVVVDRGRYAIPKGAKWTGVPRGHHQNSLASLKRWAMQPKVSTAGHNPHGWEFGKTELERCWEMPKGNVA